MAVLVVLLLPATAGAKLVRHERSAADGKQRVSRAAMARATPRELLRVPSAEADAYPAGGGADGPPGYVDGRPPAGQALAAGSGPDAESSAFGPYTSHEVADPTVYPNTTNGKVFGRIPGVGGYTCSASVVHAKNRSVLFTAGHCVMDPREGSFARKLVFVPAYDRGSRPFGRWSWDVIFVDRRWARRANINYDYAAVVMRRSRGRRVERAVGSLGFAFNIPAKRQHYRPVGYPFNKFDTEVMWECGSRYGGRDPFYRKPGPAPIGIGCDMLGGASGGGWSIANNRLASVTSFGFDDRPDELYGPRLSKRANRMRLAAGRERVG